jgi:hypothetical protein
MRDKMSKKGSKKDSCFQKLKKVSLRTFNVDGTLGREGF